MRFVTQSAAPNCRILGCNSVLVARRRSMCMRESSPSCNSVRVTALVLSCGARQGSCSHLQCDEGILFCNLFSCLCKLTLENTTLLKTDNLVSVTISLRMSQKCRKQSNARPVCMRNHLFYKRFQKADIFFDRVYFGERRLHTALVAVQSGCAISEASLFQPLSLFRGRGH